MKTVQDLINMQAQKEKLYDEIEASTEENKYLKEEKLIITGWWVDFIDELLRHNFMEFMDKHGYTEKDIDNETFTTEDIEVLKEMVIT